ncbi:biliverdin-producing heme oxygenase [Terriglobus roseus]|uniref:Heme oxygenase n=1 Tax=Terriglobus roseus TaxID=392734 RepID=A0A1G7QUA8_9BACT|nr:biliverdin-producing heme oxygenase [Terriglobus roseus]SDG01250.1 Heme oxygenase [Terriglobus roseus]
MDTVFLRNQTRDDHSATEGTVPLMDPSLTLPQYGDALTRMYRIVRAWDSWADAHAPGDLQPILHTRRRADLLADDLTTLGFPTPSDEEVPHQRMASTTVEGNPRAVFLGRMYVMEGSTLGGQLLARHVEEQLGFSEGEGDSYFRGYAEATGERWRQFKSFLEELPDEQADTVVASAKNMFALFGETMSQKI